MRNAGVNVRTLALDSPGPSTNPNIPCAGHRTLLTSSLFWVLDLSLNYTAYIMKTLIIVALAGILSTFAATIASAQTADAPGVVSTKAAPMVLDTPKDKKAANGLNVFGMTVEFKDLVELLKTIAWPMVVATALLAFHKPLSRFVAELGKRATRLSAFEVLSVEFAKIPSPPVPWSDPAIYESYKLIGGDVTSTTINDLFKWISNGMPWHYLIVDIGTGRRWLISRLFLFVVILRYLHDLRCVVFVETKEELSKRFLGIMKVETLRVTLAKKYPWLHHAIVTAWSKQNVPVLADPLPKDKAEAIVNAFLQDGQIRQTKTTPPNLHEWEQLEGPQPVWEHTKWLDIQRVNEDLREAFSNRDVSQFVDSPETPVGKRNRAILCRHTSFVALINDKGEFKGLIDRQGYLDKLALRLSNESEDGDATLGGSA